MSEQETPLEFEEPIEVDELTSLQERADVLGLVYKKSFGLEKMRALVNEAVSADAAQLPDLVAASVDEVADAQQLAAIKAQMIAEETPNQRRWRLRREATKLVRVRVMNMNPARKDWEGDTYTVSNRNIGTIKRFVPYDVEWHVEQALLNVMLERKCQVFSTRKDPRTGRERKEPRLVPELSIAILNPLTPAELKALAQRQAMAAGTAEE